jgi:sialate O-acetylesterase
MRNKTGLTLMLLLLSTTMFAKIQLPHVLSDNMVLQQKSNVKLWGKAAPNAQVNIKATWSNQKYKTQSDKDGKWLLSLPTIEAGGPYEIRISDGEEVVLKNILLGEVWFCAGQSNMEMPLKGYSGQPVEGGTKTIARAKKSIPIRMFTSGFDLSDQNFTDVDGKWMENTPEGAASCSAVAYYFAQNLREILGVPVGLVISVKGGTKIELWMSQEMLKTIPEFSSSNRNGNLFNTKIYPLSNFTIKGFLWYQGEANSKNPDVYEKLFPAYVTELRKLWGQGDLPFYYVQVAPYKGDEKKESIRRIREIQFKSLKTIPNSGMAVTTDIGDELDVHAPKKEPVGDRLAYWALTQTYGIRGIPYRAPEYKSMEVKGNKITLTFDYYTSTCLAPISTAPEQVVIDNLEIAGEDKVFHPAKAVVNWSSERTMDVYSDDVPHPVAVRYAFKNFVKGTLLFDDSGLPVSSFRTDNWELEPLQK